MYLTDETGEKCEECGEPLVMKQSRWGKEFIACSGYPKCKYTRNIKQDGDAESSDSEGEPEGAEADA